MIEEILDFLDENTGEILFDLIKEDLKIEIDNEFSSLYDEVKETKVDVSFEDIIKAVVSRVKIAISTFEK
jgi:uncharacterized membrane protein YheB (UPF0754 family)